MKQTTRKEITIGLIIIFALVILYFGIEFLKGVNVFQASNTYYASFDNVAGLSKSAPVTVNGFKVGLVSDISYEYDNPGHILVKISLDNDLKLPQGTKAVLASDLLGTASIALDMATSDSFHKPGDYLIPVVPKGMLEGLSSDLMPSVAAVFPKVDTLLTSINALVASPELAASVKRLDAITANLEATTMQLNRLMATLPPITANVNNITANLAGTTENVNTLSAGLAEMPLDSIADNLQAMTANLRILSEQLNDPNSSLGLLTRDPALYNNLNATIASLDSLFVDIKRNPKRYISIKLL